MGISARWVVPLVAAAALPPLLAFRHEVRIDPAQLPPCPRSENYLRAAEMEKQIAAEIRASRLQSADQLLEQALATLGTHYDPYVRVLDDTDQHLSAAFALESEGKLAEAIREKHSMLEGRLYMQVDPGLCNKVVTRMAWW